MLISAMNMRRRSWKLLGGMLWRRLWRMLSLKNVHWRCSCGSMNNVTQPGHSISCIRTSLHLVKIQLGTRLFALALICASVPPHSRLPFKGSSPWISVYFSPVISHFLRRAIRSLSHSLGFFSLVPFGPLVRKSNGDTTLYELLKDWP